MSDDSFAQQVGWALPTSSVPALVGCAHPTNGLKKLRDVLKELE